MSALRTFSLAYKSAQNFGSKPFQTTYLVAGKRTPIGCFNGKLKGSRGPELTAACIKASLQSINLPGSEVDEVIVGSVIQAGQGQNPARQACLIGGVGVHASCTTVNRLCSSGIMASYFAANSIGFGMTKCGIAGGHEHMSNTPFLLPQGRRGAQYGNVKVLDSLMHDGLIDTILGVPQGMAAEKTAADMKITREELDKYAILSYERAIQANKSGFFKNQIVPIKINDKETMYEDEEYQRYNPTKIPQLKPAFKKDGVVTAANASKINDAGCALVLMNEETLKKHNLKPMARIVDFGFSAIEPIDFTIAPAKAIKQLLQKTGLKLSEIEYFELNEAFAVTAISNMRLLDIDVSRFNIMGGAVAMGHPVGMSGCRIMLNLAEILKLKKAKYGIASVCNGGGGGSAVLLENLQL